MLTDTTGPVELDVPRDRAATFEPQIVKKRQRRLSGVDDRIIQLLDGVACVGASQPSVISTKNFLSWWDLHLQTVWRAVEPALSPG